VGLLMAVSLWVVRSIGVSFIIFACLPWTDLATIFKFHFYLKFIPFPLNIRIIILAVWLSCAGSFTWYSCFRADTCFCRSQSNSIFLAWCNDHRRDSWCSPRI
jgi:hypothetical protein